jgi:putative hydrolase of the HAD superfamily
VASALIFDLDNTLYPEQQFIRSGFKAVAAEVALRFGTPYRDALATLLRALRLGSRSEALQILCAAHGLPQAVVGELVDVIRRHDPLLRLPSVARETLASAKAAGWRLGVLTNGLPTVQARKVRALGIDMLVDTIVYGEEWGSGRGKPDREPFDLARCRLNVPTAQTVFVGDDCARDIDGARRVGFRTILIRREAKTGHQSGADCEVGGLDDVLQAAAGLICREVPHAA